MAVLDDLIKSIELWFRLVKEPQTQVDPNLDPVLLVPGIGGSILNAVDENGETERVWVRILGADHEFQAKAWSQFDPSTGRTVSLDKKTRILVHEDRYGLYAIDCLDPDMLWESGLANIRCRAASFGPGYSFLAEHCLHNLIWQLVTTVNEEWEIISSTEAKDDKMPADLTVMVGSLCHYHVDIKWRDWNRPRPLLLCIPKSEGRHVRFSVPTAAVI